MHVHGVFPYLFVRYHAAAEELSSYMLEFAAALDRAINIALGSAASTRQHVYKISLVSGMLVSVTVLSVTQSLSECLMQHSENLQTGIHLQNQIYLELCK